MRDAKAPKEVLPPKEPPAEKPAAKEATPAAPPMGAAKLAPPPPAGSTKAAGGPAKTGRAAKHAGPWGAKLGATAPLGAPLEKPALAPPGERSPFGAPAEKPPAAKPPALDKSATADKTVLDKPAADKPAPLAEKAVAGGRAAPPERRRALEDSVVTSAPKLPGDPAPRTGGAARPPAKAIVKTAPAHATASAKERTSGDKPAPSTSDASGVPALRPRRDHNKSPGFYSSVSPAHGADAVSGGPFAPAQQQKKPTVVGLAPPPEPVKATVPARAELPQAEPAQLEPTQLEPAQLEPAQLELVQAEPLSPAAAPAVAAAKVEIQTPTAAEPVSEWMSMAAEDAGAPPQPCSAPPVSVSPLAREEKEETSPGLGTARSRHDPNLASQVSGTDLELLLAFALDLALGCASEAWFVPLRAAVGRLLAGDAALRNAALEKALTTLANDLEQPGAFREENRQRLYGHVVAVDLALSKRMDVTGQKAIRERLIVDQLLEEIGQAHPMIPRRLKDQGLLSLESLGRLSAVDLSAKLEAPTDTAAQVVGLFQGYLEARVQRGPTVALLGKSVALKERLSALEASAEAFDRASEGEDSGARRRTRKQRQTDVTQLNLLLAEFGEAKTLAEIERCSVQAKIERIQRWIGEQETSSGRRAPKPSSPP